MISKQFLVFVLVGGLAAAVNWLSRLGLSYFFQLEIAIIAAYLIGMLVAYVLNRMWVFDLSGRSISNEMLRFGLVNLVALIQVFIVTIGLSRYLFPALEFQWHATAIAHAIGVASPVLTSYAGHRFFTFSVKKN